MTLASLFSWEDRFESYLVEKTLKTGFLVKWLKYQQVRWEDENTFCKIA